MSKFLKQSCFSYSAQNQMYLRFVKNKNPFQQKSFQVCIEYITFLTGSYMIFVKCPLQKASSVVIVSDSYLRFKCI